MSSRPLALITGASRRAGIGAAIAIRVAQDGWDIATSCWQPYDASKGALDRIVLAAAEEFRDLGIAANVINPGPTDTGWMTAEQIAEFTRQTPGGRPGLPNDCANLVRFLCSAEGGWINGQLLYSNGGLQ